MCQRIWNEEKKSFTPPGELKFTCTDLEPTGALKTEYASIVRHTLDFIAKLPDRLESRKGEYFLRLMLQVGGAKETMIE
jgi:hypothetical protein